MALFGRRRDTTRRAAPAQVSRFAADATALGWQAADDTALTVDVKDAIHTCARVLYGMSPTPNWKEEPHSTHYRDVFRTSVDGRGITVATGWTNVRLSFDEKASDIKGVSICVAELPSVLPIACIQPRRVQQLVRVFPEAPTGNAAFDERYRVAAVPQFGEPTVTPEMQQVVMEHIDWIFRTDGGLLYCVREGEFQSMDDIRELVDEVLAFIAAIPESMLPRTVDHSTDDLIERINKLESVEDAIAFLQQLTPAEREQLAHADSPLAAFADVTTPEAAFARFESLDQQQRLQIVTMFDRVAGND